MKNVPIQGTSSLSSIYVLQRNMAAKVYMRAMEKLKDVPMILLHDSIEVKSQEDADRVEKAFDEAEAEIRKEMQCE